MQGMKMQNLRPHGQGVITFLSLNSWEHYLHPQGNLLAFSHILSNSIGTH
uniref:Uncharacterized protein n=1 Tax=Arundo donax TaxID=35708 RepID=A0A0A9HUK3_ARUDO